MGRYLVVTDTPGIKQFVFGTDALAEIRGASALLDRLNRFETEDCLRKELGDGVEKIFANGGTGQFVVQARDQECVRAALAQLGAHYHQQTGGEVRPVAAVVEVAEGNPAGYRDALREAFAELQLRRNLASGRPTVPTLPFVLECDSSSHLPAIGPYAWGGEKLLLSEASRLKREEGQRKREASRKTRSATLWSGWIEYLQMKPDGAEDLRYRDADGIGDRPGKRGYIGLVYADGNAMGRLVQELDSAEVCAAFSTLVDDNIRKACYEALSEVCAREIAEARTALENGRAAERLPADILLLGGDDLTLVLLPADRALPFALRVTAAFERLTKERRTGLSQVARGFFTKFLADRSLTISCGVAIGPARYPFYLLLDLAEELLKSAKYGGSNDGDKTDYWAPSYLDFHLLAGSASPELAVIRKNDYLTDSACRRTLRPYRRERLEVLRRSAEQLQRARIPRSKLHDLFEAAREPHPLRAELRAQELFGRLRYDRSHDERRALWDALSALGKLEPYPWTRDNGPQVTGRYWYGELESSAAPWTRDNGQQATALADLVEAHDLFGNGEEP